MKLKVLNENYNHKVLQLRLDDMILRLENNNLTESEIQEMMLLNEGFTDVMGNVVKAVKKTANDVKDNVVKMATDVKDAVSELTGPVLNSYKSIAVLHDYAMGDSSVKAQYSKLLTRTASMSYLDKINKPLDGFLNTMRTDYEITATGVKLIPEPKKGTDYAYNAIVAVRNLINKIQTTIMKMDTNKRFIGATFFNSVLKYIFDTVGEFIENIKKMIKAGEESLIKNFAKGIEAITDIPFISLVKQVYSSAVAFVGYDIFGTLTAIYDGAAKLSAKIVALVGDLGAKIYKWFESLVTKIFGSSPIVLKIFGGAAKAYKNLVATLASVYQRKLSVSFDRQVDKQDEQANNTEAAPETTTEEPASGTTQAA